MLKVITVKYLGHEIMLECTHKKRFPPPQMYGNTPEDIDVLWSQGAIPQGEYQLLQTWLKHCGLMVMGPKCMDCPLAVKKTPRPGRPNVLRSEPWLPAKERLYWEEMAERSRKGTEVSESGDSGKRAVEEKAVSNEPR